MQVTRDAARLLQCAWARRRAHTAAANMLSEADVKALVHELAKHSGLQAIYLKGTLVCLLMIAVGSGDDLGVGVEAGARHACEARRACVVEDG